LGGAADEAVVDRVLDDVFDRGVVLFLVLDLLRPEAPAEDVVDAAVAFVEAACVAAVEVAHAVREVRLRRLNEQVIVVAHEAANVDAPAVATDDAVQDVDEEDAVAVVEHDGRLVVAARRDVVQRARREVATWSAHPRDRSRRGAPRRRARTLGTRPLRPRHVPGTGPR
jgi:hypothetical protein